jgi:hypothetical protein
MKYIQLSKCFRPEDLESVTEKFGRGNRDSGFDFDYVQHGGVSKNLACLTEHAEQTAMTTEKYNHHINKRLAECKDQLEQVSDGLKLYEWRRRRH